MKRYIGRFDEEGQQHVYVEQDSDTKVLPSRLDLRNHSPSGLSWGYEGNGPSQCALAMLADCVGDELALELYMDFKSLVISKLDQDRGWSMTEAQVREAVLVIAQKRRIEVNFYGD